MMDLEPSTDAGRFGYHLRELKNTNLIRGDESGYNLTELGKKIIEFVWDLIDYSRSKMIKEIPVRTSEYAIEHFDRSKITESLIREANVPADLAEDIAKEAESQLMKADVKYLTAPLIREVVNCILVLEGYEQYRHNLTRLGLPPFEISRLLKDPTIRPNKSNPETIQKLVSDSIFEQYLLLNVLSRDIADAHLRGDISIPNANYFIIRPNSIQHDVRPFLSEGLITEKNSIAISFNPPKNLHQALMLIAKLIEISQLQMSGSQSLDFFNIFLAPYVKNLEVKEIKKQILRFFQELGSTFMGPGGTLVNSTLLFEFEIPPFLINQPVAGGFEGIYGDYVDECQIFLESVLDLLIEGDYSGKPFFLPQQILKIRKNNLSSSNLENLFLKTHQVILKWGTPILANLIPDWQTTNVNYNSHLERLDSSWKEDFELDTLRTGNLDTVLINLPRIAYESKGEDEKFFEILTERVQLAISSLKIKRNQLYSRIFEDHLLPLLTYQFKGENYYRLENATNAVSFVGLPESVEIHTNSKITSKVGLKFSQVIIQTMQDILDRTSEESGFRWVLQQSCSNNWIERLLLLDKKRYISTENKNSQKQFQYYNTQTINSDLPISLSEKIQFETNFQKYLSGGHLMVLPLSESSESIEKLIKLSKEICTKSIGLYTFAFDLTYCFQCKKLEKGTSKRCNTCGITQTIGYLNKLSGSYGFFMDLSKSERFEIRNRHKFSL